jgi:hypothetical protein
MAAADREERASAAMRVKVSDQKYLRDLLLFLRECGCVAEQASRDEADVFSPKASNERTARDEIGIYIAGWRVKAAPGDAWLLPSAKAE